MSRSGHDSRLRRPLFVAAWLLPFSLAAALAVAWACVAWGELRVISGQTIRPPNAVPGGNGSLAPEHLDWPVAVPGDWGPAATLARSSCFGVRWRAWVTSAWLTPPFKGVQVVEAGWPFKAVRWTEWFVSGGGGSTSSTRARGQGPFLSRSAIPGMPGALSGFGWAAGWVPRRLPLDPIWTGLAADAAIFACVFLVTVVAPLRWLSAGRRARRVARGACARCGYDLRGVAGVACPECGAPRPGGAAVP